MKSPLHSLQLWLVPVMSGLLAGGVARWALSAAGVEDSIANGVGALVTLAVVEGLRRRRRDVDETSSDDVR